MVYTKEQNREYSQKWRANNAKRNRYAEPTLEEWIECVTEV